jgi:DNA-binding FadR family transcriptional regulator
LGDRFGVSRTHVRKLLEEAQELDLVRLTKTDGQFVELLPPVLQAFDRLVAEAISGLDLCYELALRRP